MLNIVKKLWKEEKGQGLAEYAVILLLIAVEGRKRTRGGR